MKKANYFAYPSFHVAKPTNSLPIFSILFYVIYFESVNFSNTYQNPILINSFHWLGLDFMDNTGVRVDYENALINAGFGKFHFYLLAICGLIYLNTAVGITIISFVLPSATCDFQMSSKDKGLLTAAPMLGLYLNYSFSLLILLLIYFIHHLPFTIYFAPIGMLLGSYFWGCLADTKGRKVVLIATLLLDGFCGLLSSVAQYYSVFMLFRFFNGFGYF